MWNEAVWTFLSNLSCTLVLDLEETGLRICVDSRQYSCSLVNRCVKEMKGSASR